MRLILTIFLLLSALYHYGEIVLSAESRTVVDSNTAFYEGELYRCVIPAPKPLKLVTESAALDGYSFAFIPQNDSYDSASMILGVNIYKIRGTVFDTVLCRDTAQLREHYGTDIEINTVDSVFSGSGEELSAFYVDSRKRFLPNVMFAYFDGSTEVVIFELVISPSVFRPKAEELFIACIRAFKALRRGTLGNR